MKHSARYLSMTLGVQPSTITRDIKKGRTSAEKNERGEWEIDASEIARVYGERISIDDAGNICAKPKMHDHANDSKPNAMAEILQVRLEAAEQLLEDRERTIEDLRKRLDSEAEERRKLTALLTDQRAKEPIPAPTPAPAPQRTEQPKGWRGIVGRLVGQT